MPRDCALGIKNANRTYFGEILALQRKLNTTTIKSKCIFAFKGDRRVKNEPCPIKMQYLIGFFKCAFKQLLLNHLCHLYKQKLKSTTLMDIV